MVSRGMFATNGKNKLQFSTTSAFKLKIFVLNFLCHLLDVSLFPSWHPSFRFLLCDESCPVDHWTGDKGGNIAFVVQRAARKEECSQTT